MGQKLYLISGLSGTGKTSFGRYAAEKLDAVFIDQDSFYLPTKPLVQLSNGETVKNWDCKEAIDWTALCTKVLEQLQDKNVVLVGFALLAEELKALQPNVVSHVHLSYGDDALSRCKLARREAKQIDPEKDSLVVDELVWPFYLQTVNNLSKIDRTICVYSVQAQRRTFEELYRDAGF